MNHSISNFRQNLTTKLLLFRDFIFEKCCESSFCFHEIWNSLVFRFSLTVHIFYCAVFFSRKENPANVRKLKKIWKLLSVWHACKLYQTNSKKVSVNRPAAMNLRHKNLAWLVCTVPEVTVYVWHLLTYIWPRNQTYCMPLHMFQP